MEMRKGYLVYLLNSLVGTMSAIIMYTREIIGPPPIPWMPRKMISWIMDWAAPHKMEPPRKMVIVIKNKAFLPNRSLNFPARGTIHVEVSRYETTTQEYKSY